MIATVQAVAHVATPMIREMRRASPIAARRGAHHDPRWTDTSAALDALRVRRRHAVRIVDADCACGTFLIEAARYARTLGFTAVEGRGIDGSPALIGRARAAAARLGDPAIGLTFEVADMLDALAGEADFPADIVLWHDDHTQDKRPGIRARLAAAGDLIIGGRAPIDSRARAA